MNTKEKIEVMEAFLRGEKIQLKSTDQVTWVDWGIDREPTWSWDATDYRIKPKEIKKVMMYPIIYVSKDKHVWKTINLYKGLEHFFTTHGVKPHDYLHVELDLKNWVEVPDFS